MNFIEYQSLAKRTLQCDMTPTELIGNIALGICGESAELAHCIYYSDEGIVKELGDYLWYIAMLAEYFDLQIGHYTTLDLFVGDLSKEYENKVIMDMFIRAGFLADVVKKGAFHRHGFDTDEIKGYVCSFLDIIRTICQLEKLDIQEVMKRNIEKLAARYPNGFSFEDSKNRVYSDDA